MWPPDVEVKQPLTSDERQGEGGRTSSLYGGAPEFGSSMYFSRVWAVCSVAALLVAAAVIAALNVPTGPPVPSARAAAAVRLAAARSLERPSAVIAVTSSESFSVGSESVLGWSPYIDFSYEGREVVNESSQSVELTLYSNGDSSPNPLREIVSDGSVYENNAANSSSKPQWIALPLSLSSGLETVDASSAPLNFEGMLETMRTRADVASRVGTSVISGVQCDTFLVRVNVKPMLDQLRQFALPKGLYGTIASVYQSERALTYTIAVSATTGEIRRIVQELPLSFAGSKSSIKVVYVIAYRNTPLPIPVPKASPQPESQLFGVVGPIGMSQGSVTLGADRYTSHRTRI